MSLCKCILTMLLAVANAGLALGDGLFYQLPQDGTWATYSLDSSFVTDTQRIPVKLKLRIASVGRVKVADQVCRWIEVHFFDTKIPCIHPNNTPDKTYKLLIPEKHLSKGGSPIDHMLRGWAKLGPPYPDKPGKFRNLNAKDFEWILSPLILSGPLRNSRKLKEVEVESKLGKMACAGVRGTLSVERAGNKPAAKCELESRLHAKSPFGVVTADYTTKESGDAAPTRWHLKLIDFGKGATSVIPADDTDDFAK